MRSLRPGHTLVEVVVVLGLLGILGGALWRMLDRQHRLYHALGQIIDDRSQLAQGAAVVTNELRSASSPGGDLRNLTDTSFTTRTVLGTAIVCGISSPADVELAPANVARGAQLASFVSTPHPGDSVLVFDEGASLSAHDDQWHPAEIASITTPTTSCAAPIVDPIADAGASGWRVRLTSGALPPTVTVGAPVRLVRPIRVALYRSSGDDYLGISDWSPASGTWNVIQPVAGPFATPTGSASSVQFEYRDSSGAVLTSPIASTTPVALVRARAITTTKHVVRADGMSRRHYSDTLTIAVELRNRQ